MKEVRPNKQRARFAMNIIWVILVVELIALVSWIMQYLLVDSVMHGGAVTSETIELNDLRQQVIGVIQVLLQLISIVLFIRWFRRAYYNLSQRFDYLSLEDGWAAGAWFVPFVNLYRPYNMMQEMFRETKNLLQTSGYEPGEIRLNGTWVGWWWTLWIINNISGQVIYRMGKNLETLPEINLFSKAGIISTIISMMLAPITIKLIYDYSRAEEMLSKTEQDAIDLEYSHLPMV